MWKGFLVNYSTFHLSEIHNGGQDARPTIVLLLISVFYGSTAPLTLKHPPFAAITITVPGFEQQNIAIARSAVPEAIAVSLKYLNLKSRQSNGFWLFNC